MEQTLQIGIFGDSISKGIVLDAETHRYSSLKKEITEWISVTPTNSQVIRMCFWNLAETTAILTGVPFQNDRRHTMNRIPH